MEVRVRGVPDSDAGRNASSSGSAWGVPGGSAGASARLTTRLGDAVGVAGVRASRSRSAAAVGRARRARRPAGRRPAGSGSASARATARATRPVRRCTRRRRSTSRSPLARDRPGLHAVHLRRRRQRRPAIRMVARSRLERAMRVAGTESQGEVDDVGGCDALGGGQPRLVGDRVEDPIPDLRRGETLVRGGCRRLHRLADPPPVLVSIETLAGLAPEVAGGHQGFLDGRGPEPVRTPEALPDPRRGRQRDVDPGQVHQLERTHREAAVAQRLVDLGHAGRAGLEDPQGLDGERPVDPVDDEARAVGADDRRLAPGGDGRHGPRHDGRIGRAAARRPRRGP